jgi:hypothetical protein
MPIQIGNITLYDTDEPSETLKVTPITLRNYIKTGKHRGQKVGGKWMESEDNLKESFDGNNGDKMKR